MLDGFLSPHLRERRASFYIEADRATVSDKRWAVLADNCHPFDDQPI